ncbi:hypothetical protein RchiOBHm_Chr7g0202301 [Rosa chinensis]|uniref:Uncharacterized protein n=1 Tax=Rosa chinensis TaxID=74649 RepID=A0A2P6P845_ROSCH|nr:hypothetical protein RchiOBHm_Chr7g0202301 [Rosa chinensis]
MHIRCQPATVGYPISLVHTFLEIQMKLYFFAKGFFLDEAYNSHNEINSMISNGKSSAYWFLLCV